MSCVGRLDVVSRSIDVAFVSVLTTRPGLIPLDANPDKTRGYLKTARNEIVIPDLKVPF